MPALHPIALAAGMLLASASLAADCDPARGEILFGKCAACHNRDDTGAHAVGPNLHGIVGSDIGAATGFAYSAAMVAAPGTWTEARLDHFLADPVGDLPGTLMAFAGLRRADDRSDLLCFLQAAP